MVEMRWIIRKPKSTRLPPVKVLQYRQQTPYLGIDGDLHLSKNWSEWIDVPTVSEP